MWLNQVPSLRNAFGIRRYKAFAEALSTRIRAFGAYWPSSFSRAEYWHLLHFNDVKADTLRDRTWPQSGPHMNVGQVWFEEKNKKKNKTKEGCCSDRHMKRKVRFELRLLGTWTSLDTRALLPWDSFWWTVLLWQPSPHWNWYPPWPRFHGQWAWWWAPEGRRSQHWSSRSECVWGVLLRLTVALSRTLMGCGPATLRLCRACSSSCSGGWSHFPNTTKSMSLWQHKTLRIFYFVLLLSPSILLLYTLHYSIFNSLYITPGFEREHNSSWQLKRISIKRWVNMKQSFKTIGQKLKRLVSWESPNFTVNQRDLCAIKWFF